ncbi:MAG: photosystem II protein PsbQ [Prochlorotrichaceae cyanobacterium]|jgi:photosystem II protein PsbQ
MKRLKTVLSTLLLVLCASLLVACGGPVAEAPVYTPGQIAEVQRYESSVLVSYDRFNELSGLLAAKDWTNLRNVIHGPLGDLRREMDNLSSVLLASDKSQAQKLSRSFFQHLESLDNAAQYQEVDRANTLLQLAESDFDSFLNLLPGAADAA